MRKVEVFLSGRKMEVSVFAKSENTLYCAAKSWIGTVCEGELSPSQGRVVNEIGDVRQFIANNFPEWDQKMGAIALDVLAPICLPKPVAREVEVFF